MTNARLKAIGKEYLACQRQRVACKLRTGQMEQQELIRGGAARLERISNEKSQEEIDDAEAEQQVLSEEQAIAAVLREEQTMSENGGDNVDDALSGGGKSPTAITTVNTGSVSTQLLVTKAPGTNKKEYRKTQLVIVNEKLAEEITNRVKSSKEYIRLIKYMNTLKEQEEEFLATAEQVFSHSALWEYCARIKGLGRVAAMTFFTIIDTDAVVSKHDRTVTAGRIWKYCGLAPGQRLVAGQQGGYNTMMKGRLYMVGRNVIMAKDPFYSQIYRIQKEFYLNRPDIVAQNGTIVVGSCGHYITAPRKLIVEPTEESRMSTLEYMFKMKWKGIELESKKKLKSQLEGIGKIALQQGKEKAKEIRQQILDKESARLDQLRATTMDNLKKLSKAEIENQRQIIRETRGHSVHCPLCKETVNVREIVTYNVRGGWRIWVDLMASRFMRKLILSHVTEIIATAEGYNFAKHANYIPPKPTDPIEQQAVLEEFKQTRLTLLQAYQESFGLNQGNVEIVRENMKSRWESKIPPEYRKHRRNRDNNNTSNASYNREQQQQQQPQLQEESIMEEEAVEVETTEELT